jgi:hypothetical protein
MQKRGFRRRLLYITFGVLILSSMALAGNDGNVKFQGKVMELDLKNNSMSVNEKPVVWDQNTIFYSEKKVPVKAERLKIRTWVYIEGVSVDKKISALKVYLIPKYIYAKERHLYPFMEED